MHMCILFTLTVLVGIFSSTFCEEPDKQNVLQTLEVDSTGCSTTIFNDAMGRPEKIEKKNFLGNLVSTKEIFYDPAGNKSCESHQILVDNEVSHAFVTRWTYGPNHQLECEIEGDGTAFARTTRYTYYQDGKLKQRIKPDGIILTFEYSPVGKISRLYSSDQSIDYCYRYDPSHRLIAIEDLKTNAVTDHTYDAADHVIAEHLANGLLLHHRYDPQGRRTELILPDGSSIGYSYHSGFLTAVERFSLEGDKQYTHAYTTYDLSGRPQTMEMIGDLGTITRKCDEETSCLSIHSPYWSETLDFDIEGHVSTVTIEDTVGAVTSDYAYDDQQQLVEESGIAHNRYQYDSIGNRHRKNEVAYCIDGLNQLTEEGDSHYSYDDNGNLIEMKTEDSKIVYEYDALNRLIKVKKDHTYSLEFGYDAFNRRLSQTSYRWDPNHLCWTHEEKIRYVYDGKNEIGAVNAEGQITQLRVLGIGDGAEMGAAVAIELDDVVYAPIHNHMGSVCCLVDMETATAVQCYRFSAFGEEQFFSCPERTINNPWRFCSKRSDEKTGFIFFGERDYNPVIGRWTTKDPLGTPEGVNRYAYALNQPMARMDLYGLYSFDRFYDDVYDSLRSTAACSSKIIANLIDSLSFSRYLRPMAGRTTEEIFGRGFLYLIGFYQDYSEVGVHGQGELNDKVRVTLINGILNLRLDFKRTIDTFSKTHGGVNIHYIFNASEGWAWDIFQTIFGKVGFFDRLAYQLAGTWKELIKEIGGPQGGGLIVHYAHSIGGTHTQAALSLLTEDERSMIRVITLGSPTLIESAGVESVRNYISVRDGICIFDPLRYIAGMLGLREDIIPKGTWFGTPFIDHQLTSSTYQEIIHTLGEEFVENFL